MKVPGGSYSCAQAIVERRLLGYLQSAIAPHVHSQSKGRDECAVRQQVFVGASEVSHVRLVSWATARTCVMEFLAEAVRDGSSCLPCSNVKRLLRTSCVLELIETTLNYMKLTELLQDARLSDSWTMQLQEHGRTAVPATGTEDEPFTASPDVCDQPSCTSSSARTSPCDSRTRP